MADKDAESQLPVRIPWLRIVRDQGVVTEEIINYPYKGSGTEEDPFIVEWLDEDPRNPMLFPDWIKWSLTQIVAIATLAVAFVSSAYSGGVKEIIDELHSSDVVATLGISLFVLGFATGPLLWAPMSELYGRQYLFTGTYAALTIFNAGACASQNIWTLVILRFFAGTFGSSPLTNAGGVIADMFPAEQRGLALTLFASAPFLGPCLGPVVGGYVGETIGWRWIEGLMAIFTGLVWLMGTLLIPETYAPVLLRKRAKRLTELSNGKKIYKSRIDAEEGVVTASHAFKTSLSRPWILLFREPIVLALSIYMAIVYGTLYMLFAAYPIVFQDTRGWSQGIGSLPFLGVAVGMVIAIFYAIWDNKRYVRVCQNEPSGMAPPEARLPVCAIGGIAIPIGLFWFAWTDSPDILWVACVAAGIPFGFGMVLVFLGIMNYLIDAYTIFAASVLAANTVLRSTFGAAFPLFTSYMYAGLGIHWAASVPAFLALACVPFPFLFYKYGPAIRVRCKYAAKAHEFMMKMQRQQEEGDDGSDGDASTTSDEKGVQTEESSEKSGKDPEEHKGDHKRQRSASADLEHQIEEEEAIDDAFDDRRESRRMSASSNPRFSPIKTAADRTESNNVRPARTRSRASSTKSTSSSRRYDNSPWDIDRVNTRESFRRELSSSTIRTKSPKSKGDR